MNAKMDVDKPVSPRQRSLWKGPTLVTALLLMPFILGDYFVKDWNWHPGAHIILGSLIFCAGFAYELITRKRDALAYRAAVVIAFVTGFGLMWGNFVQMADVNPANATYFCVPIVGIIGAAVARLRPLGMSRALFVTALAQVLVLAALLVLLVKRNPQITSWNLTELRGFAANAVDAMLFVGSALLFRKAGRGESASGAV